MTAGPVVRKVGDGGRECRYLVVKGREKLGQWLEGEVLKRGLIFQMRETRALSLVRCC